VSRSPRLTTERVAWARGPWTGVRYRTDIGPNGEGGFEMRCEICAAKGEQSYWPLDLEFWTPSKGLTRCKSCWNAYERDLRAAAKRRRGGVTAKASAAQRAYQRDWAARKRQQEREAEGRERYERRKAA